MKNRFSIKVRISLLLASAVFFLASCGGLTGLIEVTEGYGGVLLNVQGTAPTTAVRAADTALAFSVTDVNGVEIGLITLTEARLVLSEIELEQDDIEIDTDLESEQDLESEIEFEGPFIVDLLNNTVEPEILYTELLPGTYTEINMKLNKIDADDFDSGSVPLLEESDPLYGNSIYLAGSYTGTVSEFPVENIPFSFSFNSDEDFETEAGDFAEGIVIDEGIINPILIAFRLARWFQFDNPATNPDSVDFYYFNPADDGLGGYQIIFDETQTGSNAAVLDVILKNIKESADYGEDEDLSGTLESDEDDDPDSEDDEDF